MKLKDLKPGMIVQIRRGDKFLVLDTVISNNQEVFPLFYYNENMYHRNSISEWDIMKVLECPSCELNKILSNTTYTKWERKDKTSYSSIIEKEIYKYRKNKGKLPKKALVQKYLYEGLISEFKMFMDYNNAVATYMGIELHEGDGDELIYFYN